MIRVLRLMFKFRQFADDKTLTLAGSQPSLQAVLNILEIYANIKNVKILVSKEIKNNNNMDRKEGSQGNLYQMFNNHAYSNIIPSCRIK